MELKVGSYYKLADGKVVKLTKITEVNPFLSADRRKKRTSSYTVKYLEESFDVDKEYFVEKV